METAAAEKAAVEKAAADVRRTASLVVRRLVFPSSEKEVSDVRRLDLGRLYDRQRDRQLRGHVLDEVNQG